jgi:hypothetical protein
MKGILLASMLVTCGLGTAAAQFTDSSFITFTLEGCRNDGTIALPISGQFICPDAPYTTGNLGKGWNELDLVPHRLTTSAGSQSGVTTTYNVYIAADYQLNGKTGYDVISAPAVNTPKSAASCSVVAGPESTQGTAAAPFGGGTDVVRYRLLTVTQNAGTTCVFDYYQRLALGSHLYPGSSLQSYIFEQAGLSGSKKTISIPVNEILPQSISKDMSALQDSTYPWDITKSPTTNSLSFGNVCAATPTTSLPLSFTVTWTKGAVQPNGNITVTTHVYATNPAARTITTAVTDVIYSGTTILDTVGPVSKDVSGNTANVLVLTHTFSVPAGTTNLNDIATGTYTDLVTGVPVPGTTTAIKSASVQGSGVFLNATASILDIEALTGLGLTFSVPAPSSGAFAADATTHLVYTAGDKTQGPVDWQSSSQTDSSSITFNKTVYLDGTRVTSGILTDSAALAGSDGLALSSGAVNVNISSSASPSLTISKTIPAGLLSSGQSIVTYFKVTRAGDSGYSATPYLTFGPGDTTKPITFAVSNPDIYQVTETDAKFFPVGCTPASPAPACALPAALTAVGGSKTVDLSQDPNTGIVKCSGTATITNVLSTPHNPTVEVSKKTLPGTDTGNWTFTLKGPGLPVGGITADAVANGAYKVFPGLTSLGTYTMTETTKDA